jgi:hypothetical protein
VLSKSSEGKGMDIESLGECMGDVAPRVASARAGH